MIVSEATVGTEHASRYLQQLSKHWSHKFGVTFDRTRSVIPFAEDRSAELLAEPDRLRIRLTVPDHEALARTRRVIEEHLNRFAFRETLRYDWR